MGEPVPFSVLASDQALVCRREINGEQGGATVYCVLLSDGFLLDCGTGLGEVRARVLAEIINAGGPEKLSRSALTAHPDSARGR
jgi:hypothetical protein